MKPCYTSNRQLRHFAWMITLLLLTSQVSFAAPYVLFQQNFSSSSSVSSYVNSTTPSTGQFNAISSVSGSSVAISGGSLVFTRASATSSFSRSTDLSPVPPTMSYQFKVTVTNGVATTRAAEFQVGSGFSTANSLASASSCYGRLGVDITGSNGFTLRNMAGLSGTAYSGSFTGTQTVTWVLNNSGSTITYLDPAGNSTTLGNDKMDVYVGTTNVFNEIAVTTANLSMTDLKFGFTAGTGDIALDDMDITFATTYVTCPAATETKYTDPHQCYSTFAPTAPGLLEGRSCFGGTSTAELSADGGSSYDPVTLSSPPSLQFVSGNWDFSWRLTDGCGNISMCSQTVTVVDNEGPTFYEQDGTTPINCTPAASYSRNMDAGTCTYTAVSGDIDDFQRDVIHDNCIDDASLVVSCDLSGATTASGLTTLIGHVFNKGTTTATWTASDGTNSSTCSYTIVVIDNQNPSITCTGNKVLNADNGGCTYTNSGTAWDATGSDNCTAVTFSYNLTGATSGTGSSLNNVAFNRGITTVTWTATDGSNNTSTCSFTVTISDSQNPTITSAGNKSVNTDAGVCTYTHSGTAWNPTGSDNCGTVTYSYTMSGATTGTGSSLNGVVFNLGVTNIVWTITDGSSLTATASQSVTVTDNQNPTITAPATVSVNAASGLCTATVASLGTPTTADNCSVASVVNDHPSTTYPVGSTTVTWTVTDGSGRTATATQTVTVTDAQLPVINCAITGITQQRSCAGAVTWTAPTASDNCGVASLTSNKAPGDNFTVGTTTVTYTATDVNGNVSSYSFDVTITQITAAAVQTPVSCNGGSNGSVNLTVSDAAGTPTYLWSNGATTEDLSGLSAGTYSVTVTDGGCSATASATVTEPTVLVVSSGTQVDVSCNGGSNGSVVVSATGGTAPYTGTGSKTNLAAGTYSYTVTDANGCASSVSVTITEPTQLSASSSAGSISCNGGTTTVSVTASGGTTPYSGDGSFTRSAGSYSYTVTDAKGCTAVASGSISQPTLLTASSTAATVICGNATASVTVTAGGGTTPYSGDGVFATAAGAYSYTVTDANGCTAVASGTMLSTPITNANTGLTYTTIQAAITAATAGDVINVCAGTYAENITVSKSLDLRGPNYNVSPNTGTRVAEAILVPASTNTSSGAVVTITSGGVSFKGFTVDGDNTSLASSGFGLGGALGTSIDAARTIFVNANGISGVTIANNIAKNSVNGIRLEQTTNYFATTAGALRSTNILVNDNKVQDMTGTGIRLGNSMYAKVTNNTVSNADNGIAFSSFRISDAGNAADRVIENNTISSRYAGIWVNLYHASPYAINNNTITPAPAATSMAPTPQTRTAWYGIMYSTVSCPQNFTNQVSLPLVGTPEWWTASNNNIDGAALESTSVGHGYWLYYVDNNRDGSGNDHYGQISGGTVSNVDIGIFLKNKDTDPATNFGTSAIGAHANVSGVSFSLRSGGIGFKLVDDATWTTSNPAPLINKRTVALGIGSGVSISGGATGLSISHPAAGTANYTAYNSITGGDLSNIALSGQSGDYVSLTNHPNGLTATSSTFDGVNGASATLAQNYAIEDKISHATDNSTRGLVRVKAANVFVTTNSGSIQRGVDAASNNDLVNVAAGTYSAGFSVSKPLTVDGDVAATTIIDLSSNAAAGTVCSVANVTGNATIRDFTMITGPASAVASIGVLTSNNSGGTISILNNIIYGVQSATGTAFDNYGVTAGYGSTSALLFDNNTVYGGGNNPVLIERQDGATNFTNNTVYRGPRDNSTRDAVFCMNYGSSNVTTAQVFSNNTIDMSGGTVFTSATRGAGITVVAAYTGVGPGGFTNVTVSNNSIVGLRNSRRGIIIWNNATSGNVVATVSGNEISAASGHSGQFGIDLLGPVSGAVVTNNKVSGVDRAFSARTYAGGSPSGASVNNNSLLGAVYHIDYSGGSGTLNATCNWYGSYVTSVISPKINGSVTYNTWLVDGTDNNLSASGFQPVPGSCIGGSPVVPTETHVNNPCLGGNTGSIDLSVSGGFAPYTFAWSNSETTEDISGLVAGTYSVTVTDQCGTTGTIAVIISDIDVAGPVLSETPANTTVDCQSVPVVPVITATDQNPTSPVVNFSSTSTQGTNPALSSYYNYVITRTWSSTDACGQNTTYTQTITVQDVTAPSITTCPSDRDINLSSSCTMTVPSLTGEVVASDNCASSNLTITQSPAAGTVVSSSHNATQTVTITVADPSGRSTTCTVTLTGKDVTNPTVAAASNVSVGTDLGACTASVIITDATFADNCGATLAYVMSGATTKVSTAGQVGTYTFNKGVTTITYTATDAAGNLAVSSMTVTVSDNENPTVAAASNVSVGTDLGACTASVIITDATFADNCGATLAYVMSGATTKVSTAGQVGTYTFNKGVTTITYTATDAAGNLAVSSMTVTVSDNENPTVAAASNVSVGTDLGACTASVIITDATFADNCGATLAYVMSGATTKVSTAGQVGTYTFNKGVTTITYTATDAAGNLAVSSMTVTVSDNENPTVAAASNVSVSTDAGACTASVAITNVTFADNCGATLAYVMSGATTKVSTAGQVGTYTFNKGVTTITYTATDAAGNLAVSSMTVTVSDNENPTVAAASNVSVGTDLGACTASVIITDATFADNCGATLAYVMSGATTKASTAGQVGTYTFNKGVTTITYTATDAAGNLAVSSMTVTVSDNENPTVAAASSVSVSTDAGACTASVIITDATFADNCGATLAYVMSGATTKVSTAGQVGTYTFNKGVTTITYTATDAAGNLAVSSMTVTVSDNENPTVAAASSVSVSTDAGACTASVIITDATFADNCGATLAYVMSGATTKASTAGQVGTYTFNKGVTTITYTATDAAGNLAVSSMTVTVSDNENPTVAAASSVSVSTDAGACTASVIITDATFADNCGATLAYVMSGATTKVSTAGQVGTYTFNKGVTTITYTATDAAGNLAVSSMTVTVSDNENPTVAAASSVSVSTDAGACTASVIITDATFADNCGATLAYVMSGATTKVSTAGQVGTYTFNKGVTTITYTATDAAGNLAVSSMTVTVSDNENPTVAAASSVSVSTDLGACTASVIITDATFADNCGATLAYVMSGATTKASTAGQVGTYTFNKGVTTITYTATDAAGNLAVSSMTVTVSDNENPTVAAASNVSVGTDLGACTASVIITDATFADNCGATLAYVMSGATTKVSTAGQVGTYTFNKGVTTITYTATDAAGNLAVSSMTVTVSDNENPTVAAASSVSVSTDLGACTASVIITDATFADNCGATLAYVMSGATTKASTAGQVGTYTFNKGVTTITYTATDAAGNLAVSSMTVTVSDNENPTVAAASNVSVGTDLGACTASVIITDATFADNCGATLAYVMSGATTKVSTAGQVGTYTFNKGVTTITYTATDAAGNLAVSSMTVTVSDNENPTVAAASSVSVSTDLGACTASVIITDATFADNCGATLAYVMSGATTKASTAGQVGTYTFNKGVTTITYTATDAAGNLAVSSMTVTVSDNENPTVAAASSVSVSTDLGACTASVIITDATFADNCGATLAYVMSGATTKASTAGQVGTYTFNKGVTTITYTATDAAGNLAVSSMTVTVSDNENPTVAAASNVSVGTDLGACTASVIITDATFADNCGATLAYVMSGATTKVSTAGQVGTYTFNKGVTTITYTATDAAGNLAVSSMTVTVSDNENPTVAAASNVSVGTDLGACTASVIITDATFADNCGATLAYVMSGATTKVSTAGQVGTYTFNKGVTTITYTATDAAGNTAVSSMTVTVSDNEKPTITAPANVTVSADLGGCSATSVSIGSASVNDNCSVASTVNNHASTTYPVGVTTVIWTVTDAAGNTATASQTVTVLDGQNPVINGMPSSFVATNTCPGIVSWTAPTASDNCSVTLTSNYAPGDNFPAGNTVVTYTATDASGNTATASFTVTINSVSILASSSPALCNGGATGSATVAVTNAQGTISYSWSNGATTQSISNLTAGTYTVTVVNSGCTVTSSTTVGQPTALAATASVTTNVTCYGGDDAAATVVASGGTSPYSYLWNDPMSTATASVSGLEALSYSVAVTDANGCSVSRTVTPSQPAANWNIVETVTRPLCNGNSNGAISIAVSGNTSPYTFVWSNGPTTQNISGLAAGSYTVSVTDSRGCNEEKTIAVTQPDVLAVGVVGTDVTCYGARDGMVTATVTGGTTAYAYVWYSTSSGTPITGQTSSVLTGRSPGSYYVRVTDANACNVTSSTVTLTQPPVLLVSVSKTNVSCFGGANGTANASASGGNGGYQYYWTKGTPAVYVGSTARITGLTAGSYTVRVTDTKGCVRYATVTLTQPATALSVAVSRTGSSATATPSGGTSPYTYLWSTGARTATANGLVSGIVYSVRVTDKNGCTVTGYTASSRTDDPGFFQNVSMDAQLYPNPTTGEVTLEFNAADQDHYQIRVMDFSGRTIDVNEGTATMGLNRYRYDLSGLAQGIYLVRVERAGEVQVLRVVLK